MIPELGHVALILALQMALIQAFAGLYGAHRGNSVWMAMARSAAAGQLLFVLLGFSALAWSFYVNDFSVMNVAEHSARRLPVGYRLTATWGSHEGSILLWVLILAGWTLAVRLFSRSLPVALSTRVLAVMGLISIGLISFLLFTSNPFMRLDPPPPNGLDLNPLLQDPGMILHPPLLYMGYAGFCVAFAFAIAALLSGQFDAAWARWSRPWTLAAWSFLTVGIGVGSWWAYYELGWGGWWFWDPTENASLMPWLVGTALVHSLVVSDQRDCFRAWTLFLAIAAFWLSLMGTFLVRSGVLTSVHAFAQDPMRGLFILIFLVLVIGGALALFAKRAGQIRERGQFALWSRETLLLGGNVLLLVAMASVFLGTLYPLALDALDLGKISVGPPYFNTVFIPLILPVLVLLGLAPFVGWRQGRMLVRGLPGMAVGAVVVGVVVSLLMGELKPMAVLGVSVATWILLATGRLLWLRREGGWSPGVLGMGLAHGGLAVAIIGMTLVSAFEQEQTLTMAVGHRTTLGPYEFVFKANESLPGPNYAAARAQIEVLRDGQLLTVLAPEKRMYEASKMPMTESAIRYGFKEDVYIALGEMLPDESWTIRFFIKPLISWIWVGGLLMVLGGLLAAVDRRYRRAQA